jgi:peptide/nickel transport system ATP-binding protein
MVDASLRMSIVNLFKTLRDDLRVSIIHITHDLATAYYISDPVGRRLLPQRPLVRPRWPAAAEAAPPRHRRAHRMPRHGR